VAVKPVLSDLDFGTIAKGINHPDPVDPLDVANRQWVLSVAGSKVAGLMGNGVLTVIDIAHGLGTLELVVQVNRVSDGRNVIVDFLTLDPNTVRFEFVVAPALNSLRYIIRS
jgi:hypothetical protein